MTPSTAGTAALVALRRELRTIDQKRQVLLEAIRLLEEIKRWPKS